MSHGNSLAKYLIKGPWGKFSDLNVVFPALMRIRKNVREEDMKVRFKNFRCLEDFFPARVWDPNLPNKISISILSFGQEIKVRLG